MRASVVIGANFGDEGKGLMTDWLCASAQGNCVVARFNGGAQAGHTVVGPNGRRHVFHHFGSGSLTGAATFLSRFFVVNPWLWIKEINELRVSPRVIVDPSSPLTTPYDMLINQEAETLRGLARHGSCGIGFNETIERNSRNGPTTTAADMCNTAALREKLSWIRKEYVGKRISELADAGGCDRFWELVSSDSVLESFLTTTVQMRNCVEFGTAESLAAFDAVVFEGAQGLLLDQDGEHFPHVTRSKTGAHNAMALANEAGIEEVDAYYITRAHMTRHGAGPFPTEDVSLSFEDPTNAPNAFQGSLRFGRLDVPGLCERVKKDAAAISGAASIAVTCLDQISSGDEVLKNIGAASKLPVSHVSHGPCRANVREMQHV